MKRRDREDPDWVDHLTVKGEELKKCNNSFRLLRIHIFEKVQSIRLPSDDSLNNKARKKLTIMNNRYLEDIKHYRKTEWEDNVSVRVMQNSIKAIKILLQTWLFNWSEIFETNTYKKHEEIRLICSIILKEIDEIEFKSEVIDYLKWWLPETMTVTIN